MTSFCQHCGTATPPTARFCSNCGLPVNGGPATMPTRPLFRPRVGRAIAGVCLCFSQSYGWDVALVRVFAVLGLCFSAGMVGVAYLACWIGIPSEPPALP